ncbi:SRPBCC family protein [Allorhizocola rhizosphaerae]|uniref:SRPBCC family protein n=1 Tax=Allorhizocola rhizosphaerae TaxID=1872709 RepID=UPI000E3D29EF|nr:SRPBCC domain-containing protein [Allorhizocola rhizosphaerae]
MEAKLKPFRVETTIDAPREVVWRALTTPSVIREWFGWDDEGLEGEIRYIFVDHAKHLPPDRITLALGQELQLEADGPHRTVVRAVLPGSLDEADWEDIFDAIEEGWRTFFEQLRFMVAHSGSGRHTLRLGGKAKPSVATDLARSIGGHEVWHRSRYQLMFATPDGRLVGLMAESPLDDDAEGPISLQVTAYGPDGDDNGHAELRDRWAALVKDPEFTP